MKYQILTEEQFADEQYPNCKLFSIEKVFSEFSDSDLTLDEAKLEVIRLMQNGFRPTGNLTKEIVRSTYW